MEHTQTLYIYLDQKKRFKNDAAADDDDDGNDELKRHGLKKKK